MPAMRCPRDRSRIVVPKLRYVAPRDGDDDPRDHPVQRVWEADEPHLPGRDPFVDRVSPRESSGDARPLFPGQAKRLVIEDVDVESAAGVDDLQPGPPRGELVVQRRRLSTDLLELPVAERKALMALHLLGDVPVDRAVQVLRVQVEGKFLPGEERTAPCVRVIEPGFSSALKRGVHISIVVQTFREVLHEIGTEVLDVANVVDDQRNVLQVSESPRVDSGVPAEDQRVDPLAPGGGHPFRRGTEVHRPPVEAPAIR